MEADADPWEDDLVELWIPRDIIEVDLLVIREVLPLDNNRGMSDADVDFLMLMELLGRAGGVCCI